jgi:beta-glucosidase
MTWDKDAIYAQSKAIATEFYLKGIQVVDGPTSQPLGRTPWGGRLVETFGPDPYLNGIATGLGAKAYKDTGVIGGIKVCYLV